MLKHSIYGMGEPRILDGTAADSPARKRRCTLFEARQPFTEFREARFDGEHALSDLFQVSSDIVKSSVVSRDQRPHGCGHREHDRQRYPEERLLQQRIHSIVPACFYSLQLVRRRGFAE